MSLPLDPTTWQPLEDWPALHHGVVHVFAVALTPREPGDLGAMVATLDKRERERAARFKIAEKREEFIICRASLRRVLAGVINKPQVHKPEQLTFRYGRRGKPYLGAISAVGGIESPSTSLQFNVSHTQGIALIAVTPRVPLGVDIETVRAKVTCDKLAERFFSPRESRAILALRGDAQREAFFRVWSRKEAFIKAVGEGVALGLDTFDVSHDVDRAELLAWRCAGDWRADFPDTQSISREPGDWSMASLPLGDGVVGAVAACSPEMAVRCWAME